MDDRGRVSDFSAREGMLFESPVGLLDVDLAVHGEEFSGFGEPAVRLLFGGIGFQLADGFATILLGVADDHVEVGLNFVDLVHCVESVAKDRFVSTNGRRMHVGEEGGDGVATIVEFDGGDES